MLTAGSKRAVTLQPRLVERVWGSKKLHSWYPAPKEGARVGEVWLTAEECLISGGEGAGKTLAALAHKNPTAYGNEDELGFPLLIKVLYPREKLSVQVHPDDAMARATLRQARGKTECWYVVSAEPGACVYVGFRDEPSAAEIRAAIADGTIEHKMNAVRVNAGDMVFVDAGTVHAIGPGVVMLETQQYSDVTYRLWDYGRGRELHIDEGIRALRMETEAGLVPPVVLRDFDRLVSCAHFTVDRFTLGTNQTRDLHEHGALQVLVALGDGCEVMVGTSLTRLKAGHAVLLPAGAEPAKVRCSGTAEVIRVLGRRG